MPKGQSNGGNSSVEVPSSQICLALCQVDKTKQYGPHQTYMNVLFLLDGSSIFQDKARGSISFDRILTILPSYDRVLDLKCALISLSLVFPQFCNKVCSWLWFGSLSSEWCIMNCRVGITCRSWITCGWLAGEACHSLNESPPAWKGNGT